MALLNKLVDAVWLKALPRLAYRLILNRSIDRGAIEIWEDSLRKSMGLRLQLINSLFFSDEYRRLIARSPFADSILMNYLHAERCRLVRGLPPGELIVDLGGSAPGKPQGALLLMGYRHCFKELIIVDVPPGGSLEQRKTKDAYDVVTTDRGPVRYIYKDMAEIDKIGLKDESVDLFWMGQSLEHVVEKDFDEMLRSIHRYLKPTGYFCFDTPNRRITSLQLPDAYIHPDHKVEYFYEQLVEKIQNAGFVLIETLGIGNAGECLSQGKFLPGHIIESVEINSDPANSYIFYLKTRKVSPGAES
jgi:predicted SAM-dependent methyltransferase